MTAVAVLTGAGVITAAGIYFAQDYRSGCAASREAIASRLKAPATAKWVECLATPNAGLDALVLTVDSQNSFGALIRTRWRTTILDGKVYSVEEMR